jgi:hypothetical protein
MADARARVLPLVGGDPAGHDWWYLLRTTGLLDYDVTLSKVVIVIALSLTGYMIVLIHKYWESIKDGINFEIFT